LRYSIHEIRGIDSKKPCLLDSLWAYYNLFCHCFFNDSKLGLRKNDCCSIPPYNFGFQGAYGYVHTGFELNVILQSQDLRWMIILCCSSSIKMFHRELQCWMTYFPESLTLVLFEVSGNLFDSEKKLCIEIIRWG
jgi:hypothetical protein